MKLTFELPDNIVETIIKGIMENFPEASSGSALQCVGYLYPDNKPLSEWRFKFEDGDNGKIYEIGQKELLAAFPLLFSEKWGRGYTQPPVSTDPDEWDNWLCQADANDFDAFAQLVCLGEIIYG